MRKFYFFILFAVMMTGCAGKSDLVLVEPPAVLMQANTAAVVLPPGELPLPLKETLIYDLRWLGIKGAQIKTQINGIKKYKGVDVYELSFHVTSNRWLSTFFKIDSKFLSYTAVDDFRTLRQEVDRKEGRYRKHAIVEYDHDKGIGYFENFTDKSKKEFAIPKGVRDGLGSVYYFRTLPLKVGDHANFDIVLSESVYDFYGDVTERKMRRIRHLGERDAITVHPYGYLNGEQVKEGTMESYFAPTETKIPFYAEAHTPLFTSATATLREVSYE